MVSEYSPPDAHLLQLSSNTVWSCMHRGIEGLRVIDAQSIVSVVAMVPHPKNTLRPSHNLEGRVFVVEKPGLDVLTFVGDEDDPDAG